jgi:hypothetical protein
MLSFRFKIVIKSALIAFYVGAAFQSVVADDITLSDGKTVFHNATIVSQDAASVTIKHSVGVARVMIPDLPSELRGKFTYNPDAAKQTLIAEKHQIEFRHAQEATEADHLRALNMSNRAAVRLEGKILQINDDGLLLTGTGLGDQQYPVFVKNVGTRQLVDGDRVSVVAVPSDPHQYVDIHGAQRTILAFDAAKP